ncbi:MAG: sigma-70 family RNA polymerase sigma factor, partial [Bacteroidales bacterium]|nr:sigma-70 family RNA polymerase sigma factor [Bacteroidales bacterium]
MNVNLNHASDEQLVSFYITGEEEALEILIGRYQQKIFSYILTIVHDKDLAEDLFQDTFIKVIHTLRAGTYKEEGKFNQWIMRITRNLIIDYFRKSQKMAYVENNNNKADIFEFFSEPSVSVEQHMITEQINDSLRELILLLPEEQKEVLMTRLYQD